MRISHRVAQAVLRPALAVAAAVVLVGMVMAAHISPTAAAGGNLLANPFMEAKDATTGLPACWQGSGSGTNASAVSSSADAHSGAGALNLTMTQYSNGERRIMSAQDSGQCSPAPVAGRTYQVSGWFKATGTVRIVVYTRKSTGSWSLFEQSPVLTATGSYLLATWTTSPLHHDDTRISVGFSYRSAGSLTVDDVSLTDSAENPPVLNMLDGLAANGWAVANENMPKIGGHWLATSGSLQMRDGRLWSGIPDGGTADIATGVTGSAVLRAVSTRSDFGDVTIATTMQLDSLTTTSRTPAVDFDGVHLFLRYHDADHVYTVDLHRRDGVLTIKRKHGAVYTTLTQTRLPLSPGPHDYVVASYNVGQHVQITLSIDGTPVLATLDSSPGQLLDPGRVGVRGDNADFTMSRFQVSAAESAPAPAAPMSTAPAPAAPMTTAPMTTAPMTTAPPTTTATPDSPSLASCTVSVISLPNPITSGSTFKIGVSVVASTPGAQPTGDVTATFGAVRLASAKLDAKGAATLNVPASMARQIGTGSARAITVSYPGAEGNVAPCAVTVAVAVK